MKKLSLFIILLCSYCFANANIDKLIKACQNGDSQSCNSLAGIYYNGDGVKRDLNKTRDYMIKACDNADAQGCYNLGVMYSKNDIVKQDHSKSIEYFKKSCDREFAAGCYNLAAAYANGFEQKDAQIIIDLYNKACNLGDGTSCFYLGNIYYDGNSVKRDYFKAQTYYQKACEKGLSSACNNTNVALNKSAQKPCDKEEVICTSKIEKKITKIQSGCDKEEILCTNQNTASNKISVNEQKIDVLEIHKKGCISKKANSCFALGVMYNEGNNVEQDFEKAKEYFGKACDLGNSNGCNNFRVLDNL